MSNELTFHVPLEAATTKLPTVGKPSEYPNYLLPLGPGSSGESDSSADEDVRALLSARWAEDWDSPEDSKYDI